MSDWVQVDIATTTAGIEPVAAVLLELGLSYAVQDAADFQEFLDGKSGHWDYIDDELMKLKEAPTIVTVYLTKQEQGVNQLAVITRELDRLRFLAEEEEWGELTYELHGVQEEDWATAWKQYYHPVSITSRLTICPQWQDYTAKEGEIVVSMDPGMAFGTGTHESTKLCLEYLDEVIQGGENVLDIGCGSGILSIASILMGAEKAIGVDIDQVAVQVARENAEKNKVDQKATYVQGSLAEEVDGKFDIIFANIVANAIMELGPSIPELLTEEGVFITSGIIDTRAEEVEASLEQSGIEILSRKEDHGWVAFCGKKR